MATKKILIRIFLLRPYTKVVTDFFNKLIDSKSRIADDVYAYMFFCDFLNIIVIIFGFSSFGVRMN